MFEHQRGVITPKPTSSSQAACAWTMLGLLAAAGLTACGDDSASSTSDGATESETEGDSEPRLTWTRDIEPIVRTKCTKCHREGGIAPFSLEGYEAFTGLSSFLAPAIEDEVMPPWPPDNECRAYKHTLSLSPEQQQTLLEYMAGEMPEGDPADAPPDEGPPDEELVPDVVIEMPESYTPSTSVEDDYRCFLIPWPEEIQDTRYITGTEIYPGETRIVHHVITYAVTPADLPQYQALDDAEPGPGYTCFGGPGPTNGTARWVGGWVPGQVPFHAPSGVGQQLDPGTTLVMQVHYHPIGAELTDRSSIGLELATAVDRRAEILPLTDIAWLASNGSMLIPAGEPEVTHEVRADHSHPIIQSAVNRLGLAADADLEIISAGMHMHLFGTRGRLEVGAPGGPQECLLDIPRWDFNWQSNYIFEQPVIFRSGQEIGVQCWWDNSADNQPYVDGQPVESVDRDWGDGTLDEMCLGVLYVAESP